MSQQHYRDLQSIQEVESLVSQVCAIAGNHVAGVADPKKLQDEIIWTLQFNASVNQNEEIKQSAIYWINEIARALKIEPSSNTVFYDEKSAGKNQFFTVPAINSRMATFHTVRAAVRKAQSLGLPHLIFELALSEGGYTGQKKDEYAALVKAAYISLGLSNRTIYLQADHYQLDPKKYTTDPKAEFARITTATVFAIEQGVYNIDIDSSKFETVDPNKSDRENQMENARLTADLLFFIREYERKHQLPCTISIGGEVGEVGGENTKYPQVNAYLELIAEELEKKGIAGVKGLSKVSINVGSAHGGVLGPDGKPLKKVPIDFQAHLDLYEHGRDPLNPGRHVLPVQHGASTLPHSYFPLFPKMCVAEVHLATGFQNIVWDVLEHDDVELYKKMKNLVLEKFADKIAKYPTPEVGFNKERKNVTQFVKRDLLLSAAIPEIEQELEKEFSTIFSSLYTILPPKGADTGRDGACTHPSVGERRDRARPLYDLKSAD